MAKTQTLAKQQVVQTVVVLRDQDSDLLRRFAVGQAPGHPERLGERGELSLERLPLALPAAQAETNPLKEVSSLLVRVLLGVEDVETLTVEQFRQRRDQSRTIRAGHKQRRLLSRWNCAQDRFPSGGAYSTLPIIRRRD